MSLTLKLMDSVSDIKEGYSSEILKLIAEFNVCLCVRTKVQYDYGQLIPATVSPDFTKITLRLGFEINWKDLENNDNSRFKFSPNFDNCTK